MLWALGLAAAAFLPDNSLLDVRGKDLGDRRINGLRVLLGRGQEKAQSSVTLLLDVGEERVLVGDAEAVGWGAPCRNPAENSCVVTDATPRSAFYLQRVYTFRSAIIHVRPSARARLPPSAPKLPFRLVSGGQPWLLEDWGVAGLAPQSDLGDYLRRAAGHDVSLGLKLELQTAPAPAFNAFLVYNPPATTPALFVQDLPAEERFWAVVGDLLLPGTDLDLRNCTFCLSTRVDELLLSADPAGFCRSVRVLACGGGPCNATTADLGRLPELSLTFANSTFAFAAAEYTFFDEQGELRCRVGSIRPLRAAGQCPRSAWLGLGKLFLAKFPPVFTFRHDGGARLALLTDLPLPNAPSGYFWAAAALLVALVAVGALAVVVLRRRQLPAEAYVAG